MQKWKDKCSNLYFRPLLKKQAFFFPVLPHLPERRLTECIIIGLIVLFLSLLHRQSHSVSVENPLVFYCDLCIGCLCIGIFGQVVHTAGWWSYVSKPTHAWFIVTDYLKMHAKNLPKYLNGVERTVLHGYFCSCRKSCLQVSFPRALGKTANCPPDLFLIYCLLALQSHNQRVEIYHASQLITVTWLSPKPKRLNTIWVLYYLLL